MNYNQPIPVREAPLIENIAVEEIGEPLVCLSDYSHDFLFEPVYYNKGIEGSINAFYVRKQVAQRCHLYVGHDCGIAVAVVSGH